MNVTVKTSNKGNMALESQIWDIKIDIAKKAEKLLTTHVGSYWHFNFAKPLRSAIRQKSDTVRIYTAGFSTDELANTLAIVGCEITYL